MATELKLPDELQGIEGVTITRWLAKVGQEVKAGEPVVEVATEKVDTQIQSTTDGVLLSIGFTEGEEVPAGAVVALIGAADEKVPQGAPARAPEEPQGSKVEEGQAVETSHGEQKGEDEASQVERPGGEQPQPATDDGVKATPLARRVAAEEGVTLSEVKGTGAGGQVTKEDVLAHAARAKQPEDGGKAAEPEPKPAPGEETGRAAEEVGEGGAEDMADTTSLPVRRLAAEHNLNLREVAKGRPLGELTRYDVLDFIASREAGKPVRVPRRPEPYREGAAATAGPQERQPAQPPAMPAAPAPVAEGRGAQPSGAQPSEAKPAPAGEELVRHGRMRQLVAKNTVQAAFSIPHVTTMWDVNMSAVLEHRRAHKAEFAQQGTNLTITPYLVVAALAGLRAVPAANSSWTEEGVLIKRTYNIGIAVALPMDANGLGGLIVPVIKNAADLSLMGIARAVNDLAQRARNNQLQAGDLQGGTFTITNYGTSGSRFQTPVIVNGQAGILGVGAIAKRAAVVSQGHPLDPNAGDYLAFLPMTTLGFSYDHRILDGATADAFCAAVKEALENWK